MCFGRDNDIFSKNMTELLRLSRVEEVSGGGFRFFLKKNSGFKCSGVWEKVS